MPKVNSKRWSANGLTSYTLEDNSAVLHNESGPALTYLTVTGFRVNQYYLFGVSLTKEQHADIVSRFEGEEIRTFFEAQNV